MNTLTGRSNTQSNSLALVDGHRSPCQARRPYSRCGYLVTWMLLSGTRQKLAARLSPDGCVGHSNAPCQRTIENMARVRWEEDRVRAVFEDMVTTALSLRLSKAAGTF